MMPVHAFPKCLKPILVLLLLATFGSAYAQDTGKVKNDSVNAKLLQEYNEKLSQIEAQRQQDSIKKVELQNSLNQLKTTDNLKKADLERQLQALQNKDADRKNQKKLQIDSLRKTAIGYPVSGFFTDSLFVIYSRIGSLSPKERAAIISRHIQELGDVISFKKDSLKIEESESTFDIVGPKGVVMSITENDALWNDTSRFHLAEKYRDLIGNAVESYQDQTSLPTLLKEIGLALLVIGVIVLLIIYISKLFRFFEKKIASRESKWVQGIKIRDYTLLDSHQQVKFLISVNTVVKWIVILLMIYIALPVLFGIFPGTKDFAETLLGYIISPIKNIALGFWNYLPNLITILVIVGFFRYALKLIHFFKNEVEKGHLKIAGFYADWANPTYQIVRVLVFAFMLVVIFPYLPGSDSPVFKGVSVFLGFLFTFGSAGSLSNIVAGLVLTYMRLFKLGDRVKLGDVTGDVIEKSLLVTRIRTSKNEVISIPNSTVMSSHTVNYSSDAPGLGLIIHTTVTIGYDVPWQDMHQALVDAALRTDLILKDPQPFVLQTSLDDFYVSYQLNAFTREANRQATIYSDLHRHIQDVCNEHGIEIMSPHYRAGRDGSESTIPKTYRAAGE